MDPDADLAAVASLIADRHRAQMLLALLGGTPQSGSALAEAAGISRSLASAHLKKLVAGGLVRAQPQWTPAALLRSPRNRWPTRWRSLS